MGVWATKTQFLLCPNTHLLRPGRARPLRGRGKPDPPLTRPVRRGLLEKSRKTKTMTHFLDIHTTDRTALRSIIDSAHAMKAARNGRPKGSPDDEQPLAGRMVALIFEKPSTRTRRLKGTTDVAKADEKRIKRLLGKA